MLICPKCGKNSKEVEFLEAFCVECYPFNLKLPKSVKVEICKRCGRMRIKGEWVAYERKVLEEYVASKARGEFDKVRYDSEKEEMIFTVKKGDTSVDVREPFSYERVVMICPDCSKISGGYYQAIIQLRGDGRKVAKYAKILTRMLQRDTFITKSEERHGGTDIFVGNTKSVLAAVAELGLRAKITRKLVGVKEGKKFYRTTFSIRFE